jgi:hypothetical protein
VDYFLKHRRGAMQWFVIALGALLVCGAIYFFVNSQQNKAASAFAKALDIYHGLVIPNPPAGVTVETYRTHDEKNQKALDAFRAVADEHSWYAPGRLARYYAALCRRELRMYPEAEGELKELAQGGDRRVASLSKLALANLYELTDRATEAEALYKELEANPTETVPKSSALMARADLYRKTKPDEAATLYQQIQKDYPGSIAAERAGQLLAQLTR